jgi:hypothetical protein
MYRPVQNTDTPVRMALMSKRNCDTLQATLEQEFETHLGAPLSARQEERLQKALQHYMQEVHSSLGDKPISILNREVLRITRDDFGRYLQRQEAVRSAPQPAVKTVANDTLFQDTSQRFERLQTERQEVRALPSSVPDFRIPLDDEGPTSADLFERAKRQREAEALRIATTSQRDAMERIDPGLQKRITADDAFRQHQAGASRATDLALIERQTMPRHMDMPLVVPPDRRDLILSTNVVIDPTGTPRDLGQGNSNPTITYPHLASPQKTNLSQDVIIREERVVSYREVENNLFLYSIDRNWLSNINENRYSFTVVFDPGNTGNIQGANQQVHNKFRNITRIELVKAILPVEGLQTVVRATETDLSDTNLQLNVLSFPYVSVLVDELDGNNYGTNNTVDKSFGVLQYDANWYSEPRVPLDSRGYTALIPKFMKCQRVYEPTPLSTLKKLTISINQPNGGLVSNTKDVLDIIMIYGAGYAGVAGSIFDMTVGTVPQYFFIFTNPYFSRYQFSVGDTIRLANFTFPTSVLDSNGNIRDFSNWINRNEGHVVVGTGVFDSVGLTYTDGYNSVGWANVIVVDARYADPSTGATGLAQFAPDINTDLAAQSENLLTPRRLINVSRQTQLVFRVITRELDPTGQIRADNM